MRIKIMPTLWVERSDDKNIVLVVRRATSGPRAKKSERDITLGYYATYQGALTAALDHCDEAGTVSIHEAVAAFESAKASIVDSVAGMMEGCANV